LIEYYKKLILTYVFESCINKGKPKILGHYSFNGPISGDYCYFILLALQEESQELIKYYKKSILTYVFESCINKGKPKILCHYSFNGPISGDYCYFILLAL